MISLANREQIRGDHARYERFSNHASTRNEQIQPLPAQSMTSINVLVLRPRTDHEAVIAQLEHLQTVAAGLLPTTGASAASISSRKGKPLDPLSTNANPRNKVGKYRRT